MTPFSFGDRNPQEARYRELLARLPLNRARRCCQIMAEIEALIGQGKSDAYRAAYSKFATHLQSIRQSWTWAIDRRTHDPMAAQLCRDLAFAAPTMLNLHFSPAE